MQLAATSPVSKTPAATPCFGPPASWLVAGLLPAFWQPSIAGAIAWGVAVLLGGYVARGRPLRWVAIGWIASVVIPGTPLLAIAAGGTIANKRRDCVCAALLGTGLCLLDIPDVALNAGTLVILIGGVAAMWRKG